MSAPTSNCESSAHFFKYIPPGLLFDRKFMTIPETFTKLLKSTWKNKTAILRRGCHTWPVKIVGNWGFGQGWEDFVTENGVKDCNFVVFKHQGNMLFDIKVFDHTLDEMEYPIQENHVLKKKAECSTAKSASGKCKIDTNALKKTPKQKEITIPDDNQHRYFTRTLQSEYRLYLPTSFTSSKELGVGEMILRNGKTQKSWTVNVNFGSPNSYYLGGGWHDFCIANDLKKGVSFKFELVKKGIKPEANCYGLRKETINGKVVKNPYFKSIVTTYGEKDSYVDIPMKFARPNGFVNRNCESVVMDEKRRLWKTTICGTTYRVRLRGLRDIWDANELMEGDEFVVELVENGEKPLLNLHGMKRNNVRA